MKFYLKTIFGTLTLLICLLASACQPDGGDLAPILQEGSKITSAQSRIDNALQFDTDVFSIKVSGTWQSLRGEVFCLVVVRNHSQGEIMIDFGKAVVSNSLNENIKTMSVSTAYRATTSENIDNKIAEISAGQTLAFGLSIGEKNGAYKGNIKYRGNEFNLTIPISIEQKNNSTIINRSFNFKYADYQPEGEYKDELVD